MNILLLPSDTASQTCITTPMQVRHVRTVLKAKVGDSLKVGIEGGNLGTATIAKIDNHAIELSHIYCPTAPPNKLPLTLILALPRPKVLRRLIMDMTAIGAKHIILINSYRTDKSYWQSPMLDRLDEFMQAGLQQGCDTVKPQITLAKRFKPFVQDELPNLLLNKAGVVCHPSGQQTWQGYVVKHAYPQLVCIGCEGGWIDYEIGLLAEQGVQAVSFGSRILRTEAMVNAVCGQYLS